MNIGDTIAPNSDQLDAVDLLAGARTFTIERVTENNTEQPYNFHLAEFPRPWRPGKSMRRVLVAAWGPDAALYAGRRLTLWCDPSVIFGGAAVGGVRITHMSHIDRRKTIPLLVSRGKSAIYTVEPLPEEAAPQVATVETLIELTDMFARKGIPAEAQLSGVNRVIGGNATDLECITEQEARRVIAALEQRPDAEAQA